MVDAGTQTAVNVADKDQAWSSPSALPGSPLSALMGKARLLATMSSLDALRELMLLYSSEDSAEIRNAILKAAMAGWASTEPFDPQTRRETTPTVALFLDRIQEADGWARIIEMYQRVPETYDLVVFAAIVEALNCTQENDRAAKLQDLVRLLGEKLDGMITRLQKSDAPVATDAQAESASLS